MLNSTSDAVSLLCVQRKPGIVVPLDEFTVARNHILVLLAANNATRSGALCNFTMSDYENGIRDAQIFDCNFDDGVTFTVTSHKTVTVHGPATFCVSKEESMLLASYIVMRKNLGIIVNVDNVFIKRTGTPMNSSGLAACLSTAFAKSGFSNRVNCNKLRKTSVSYVHTNHPDKRHDMSAHMLHRLATAEKTYRLVNKRTNSKMCSELLRKAYSVTSKTPVVISKVSAQPEIDGKSHLSHAETTEITPMADTGMEEETSVDDIDDPEYMPEIKGYIRRNIWTSENKDLVFQKFQTMIKTEKTPLADVKDMLMNDPGLYAKLEADLKQDGMSLVRVVRDKIRSFFRRKYGFK